MKSLKYLLDQKDKELLNEFQIIKEVQIKLFKLQANSNTNEVQNVLRMSSSSCNMSISKLRSTDHVECGKGEDTSFKCHLCPYSSTHKSYLKRHSWTHSAHKQFNCDKCSYETNYKRDLQNHTNLNHNKNPGSRKRNYPCQLCSKRFFTMSALQLHLSVHTKEKPFSCQFCSTEFISNANRNSHEIICTQNPKRSDPVWVESQKRFQCELCGKKWSSKCELTVHIRFHTQERPYQCQQCDYAGATTSLIKSHLKRRHNSNKIKSFKCELCQKMFFTKAELYLHINTHTKESLSECLFCKKQFAATSSRNRHQIICKSNPKQSDEAWVFKQKKYKCEFCDYLSTQKKNVERHSMSHTG